VKLVYALEPIPYGNPMIFLAGPTPRSNEVKSWRPEMISWIEKYAKHDVPHVAVLVPEDRSGTFHGNYDHQTEWEYLALSSCDAILFWVPRDVAGGMPGFTTNVEFGFWLREKPVILGFPEGAEKMTYLTWLYSKVTRKTPCHRMDLAVHATLTAALKRRRETAV
jgi:nucleoside 2-deoxyribosyltransferase